MGENGKEGGPFRGLFDELVIDSRSLSPVTHKCQTARELARRTRGDLIDRVSLDGRPIVRIVSAISRDLQIGE
jgi:hypothetical protein